MLHLDPPHNHGLPNENPVDGVSENQVNQGQPETETETETVPEETWTLEHEEELQAAYRGYRKAQGWIIIHRAETEALMAKEEGSTLTEEE